MTPTHLHHELDDGVDGGEQLQQIMPGLGALIAQLAPADLRLSTPCQGWTTRDLLNHLVGGAEMFADAFGGAPLRDISGRLPDAIGDSPTAVFESAVARFAASTQQPGAMDRVLPLPFGAMTGATFLRFAAFDLLVHSWDLATAMGEEIEPPDQLVIEVDAFAHRVLSPSTRDGINFQAEVPAPDDASPIQRLVAFTGRQPAPQRSLEGSLP